MQVYSGPLGALLARHEHDSMAQRPAINSRNPLGCMIYMSAGARRISSSRSALPYNYEEPLTLRALHVRHPSTPRSGEMERLGGRLTRLL